MTSIIDTNTNIEITSLLKKIGEIGKCGYGAVVLGSPTNNGISPGSSQIIRIINTPGGPQYALHQLTYSHNGLTTGSGYYGSAEEIATKAISIEEHSRKNRERFNLSPSNSRWQTIGYTDLPPNLLIDAA